MKSYVLKKKITKACIFCAIPHTFLFPFLFVALYCQWAMIIENHYYSLLDIINECFTIFHFSGGFADFLLNLAQYPICHTIFDILLYALFLLGPVALIVSTITCGTIGRVFRKGLRAGLAVIRFCPIIILTVMFFVVWFSLAAAAFLYVIMFMLVFPSVSILISYRKRFGKQAMFNEAVLV